MIAEIFRFMVLFIFMAIGFSSAFHILFPQERIYSTFTGSLLTTSIGIFSGYDIPEYNNLLSFPVVSVGYFVQAACVLIGVVLLINFLIAMMSTIYDVIQDNSTAEYRWRMTREGTLFLKISAWPVPFNLIQLFFELGKFLKKKVFRG